MAKKTKLTKDKLISLYMESVLEQNQPPKSVFAFAKMNQFDESDFYSYYGSFQALESSIYETFFFNTIETLEKSKDYTTYEAQNKLLSFYFTFFGNLTANRSYVAHSLAATKDGLNNLKKLKPLRKKFLEFIDELELVDFEIKNKRLDDIKDSVVNESYWIQLLVTLKFWLDDDSADFEKTDLFIEKSIAASFELASTKPLKSVVDFGKFFIQRENSFELMKSIDRIPTSKLQRASKIVSTGAKVGVNYIKYYGERLSKTEEIAKDNLNKKNADDIYSGLKQLKGSALKVAQMLSMEKNILPQAYVEKFSLAQFSVPPLSSPLVVKTFKKYFGQAPDSIFDEFDENSVNAASIGQVHRAKKNGKDLAVKIQYPGVADSIKSDLSLVKPIAMKMFNIKGKGSDKYFKEVEDKLTEETNYTIEIEQSQEIAKASAHIPNLLFPKYYKEYSSKRILTMDFMEGQHLSEFTKQNTDQKKSNKLGQALWDFYMHQIHNLKKVHADPHPGNFLINDNTQLIALDFGCMKVIPDVFYVPYFELANTNIINDPISFSEKLYELEILTDKDTKEETTFFTAMFHELLSVFTLPFQNEVFDFSDPDFFGKIGDLAEQYSQNTELRKFNSNRGSKHFIYMNRTFFGLYNLMFDLKSNAVKINQFQHYK